MNPAAATSGEARLLRAFGIQWTIFVVLANVAIEALGAEEALSQFSVAVGAAVGFALVYATTRTYSVVRPRRLIPVACAAAGVLTVAPILVLTLGYKVSASETVERWENPSSLYVGAVVGLTVGLVIEAMRASAASDLPAPIRESVLSVSAAPLYLEYMRYDIEVRDPAAGQATFVYRVDFKLVNRTYRDQIGVASYGHLLDNLTPSEAIVDGKRVALGLSTPGRPRGGLTLPFSVPPLGSQELIVEFSTRQTLPWTDVFSVYRPACEMTVRLKDKVRGVRRDRLHSQMQHVETEEEIDSTIVRSTAGTLPYNSVIVTWGSDEA